jgi:hypothetical protein
MQHTELKYCTTGALLVLTGEFTSLQKPTKDADVVAAVDCTTDIPE